MEKRASSLAKQLDTFYSALQKEEGEEVDEKIVKILAPSLCKLARLVVPDIQKKINEIIYANEKGLKVLEHQHGADLEDEEGNTYEHKSSKVTTRKGYKCNFNWPIPVGNNDKERREKLIEVTREKTKGTGKSIFQILDGKDRVLFTFEFCSEFLVAYFERVKLGKSDKHNFGCEGCTKCKKFPRLERIKKAELLFRENPESVNWEEGVFVRSSKHDCTPVGEAEEGEE